MTAPDDPRKLVARLRGYGGPPAIGACSGLCGGHGHGACYCTEIRLMQQAAAAIERLERENAGRSDVSERESVKDDENIEPSSSQAGPAGSREHREWCKKVRCASGDENGEAHIPHCLQPCTCERRLLRYRRAAFIRRSGNDRRGA